MTNVDTNGTNVNVDETEPTIYGLTTIDNPYSPFEDFAEWFLFDVEHGYNTCGYLARIARTNDEMTEQEFTRETNRAIDEILKYDFANIYRRVDKNSEFGDSINKELQANVK